MTSPAADLERELIARNSTISAGDERAAEQLAVDLDEIVPRHFPGAAYIDGSGYINSTWNLPGVGVLNIIYDDEDRVTVSVELTADAPTPTVTGVMTAAERSLAYVQQRFGPNWQELFNFYAWVRELPEDKIIAIRAAYYAAGRVNNMVMLGEAAPGETWRWMRAASSIDDCPSPSAADGAEPLAFATADAAQAVVVRHVIPAEVFNEATRPWLDVLGPDWTNGWVRS